MRRKAEDVGTLAVNLIMKGRHCLVVGGGRIASRKLRLLLSAGAEAKLVAPKLSQEAEDLCAAGSVEVLRREFQPSDLEGARLVFSATDDKNVNSKLVSECKLRGILCCAVDENWPEGDFITPASFEGGGVRVAVSTGGASSRKSRIIKESLSKRAAMLGDAELMVVGTDHNYLSLAEREPYHLVGSKYGEAGEMLSCVWGLHEFMLLNTCNRVELAAVVSTKEGSRRLALRALSFDSLPEGSYYVKRGMEAFSHLASVAAGLMSQTPGEKHIVSQLKGSLDAAKERGWAGPVMQDWLDATLHLSKHIRAETEPHYRNYEIEDLAFKFAKDWMKLDGVKAIVIGTGDVGGAIARMLAAEGCAVSWLYHVNRPEPFASPKGSVEIASMNSLKDKLQDVGLLVSAAASPAPLVHHGHAPFLDQSRKALMLDLGTPRNISHELARLMPNVKIADLDDLKHWHRREFVDMGLLFEISSKTIGSHREMYEKIVSGLNPSEGGRKGKQALPDASE